MSEKEYEVISVVKPICYLCDKKVERALKLKTFCPECCAFMTIYICEECACKYLLQILKFLDITLCENCHQKHLKRIESMIEKW